ncbi:MAG: hypothetical protein VX228_00395 [Pseudomonadota bacterium]|nr:hypothetical protein [Pseudomonadota bacterium]
MQVFSAEEQAALEASSLVLREFISLTVRERATGNPYVDAYWSGSGKITTDVIDPDTGAPMSQTFQGAGALIAVDDIPADTDMSVQRISVEFSQVSDRINDLVRNYDARQAKVVIWRGNLHRTTRQMIAPARPRFVGFIDKSPFETPPAGGFGQVKIECVSSMQEMTRANPDLRSHESQLARAPGDDFFKSVTTAPDQVIFWGKKSGVAQTASTDSSWKTPSVFTG